MPGIATISAFLPSTPSLPLTNFPPGKKRSAAWPAVGDIDGEKMHAFKPMGYMNTSGGPTGEASRFYKIPPEKIITIHDELDLPLGKLRVKKGGGNGGHNGLKSLDAHVGPEYWRVRVGIGHPGDKDMVSDYVLSDFSKQEWKIAEAMIIEISKNIGLLLAGDEAKFMSKVALGMEA